MLERQIVGWGLIGIGRAVNVFSCIVAVWSDDVARFDQSVRAFVNRRGWCRSAHFPEDAEVSNASSPSKSSAPPDVSTDQQTLAEQVRALQQKLDDASLFADSRTQTHFQLLFEMLIRVVDMTQQHCHTAADRSPSFEERIVEQFVELRREQARLIELLMDIRRDQTKFEFLTNQVAEFRSQIEDLRKSSSFGAPPPVKKTSALEETYGSLSQLLKRTVAEHEREISSSKPEPVEKFQVPAETQGSTK